MAGVRNIYGAEVSVGVEQKGLAALKDFVNKTKRVKKAIEDVGKTKVETNEFKEAEKDAERLGKELDKAAKKAEDLREKEKSLKKEGQTFGKEWNKVTTAHEEAKRTAQQLSNEYAEATNRLAAMEASGRRFAEQKIAPDYSNVRSLGQTIKAAAAVGVAELPGLLGNAARAGATKMKSALGTATEELKGRVQDYKLAWQDTLQQYPRLASAIDGLRERVQDYKLAWQDTMQQYPRMAASLSAMRERLAAVGQRIRGLNPGTAAAKFEQLRARVASLTPAAGRVATALKRFGIGAKNDFKTAASWAGKFVGALNKVTGALKNVSKHSGRASKALKKMKRGAMMGTGIKGFVRLGAAGASVYAIVRSIRQGFENLYNYGGETASAIDGLKASLLTMKNALATAFAPVFTAVAPAINALINMITRAATAIAHFMAALTGKSSVVVAKPISAVAGAASDAAGSTGAANDAAKEYKKTLMGFDQINKLEDPTSGSGGGGSGGGGGGGAGASDMFETVEVDSGMNGLVDRIKEAWEKADFTELGFILGEKINHALESIPWDKIQATAQRLAKSIATFLNGFLAGTDWYLVGKTIAEGLNTAIEFAYTFVTTFDWSRLGNAIGNFINGALLEFDWAKLAKTISGAITGLLDTIINALTTIKWSEIGAKVAEFLLEINWADIIAKVIQAVGKAITGAAEMLYGFVKTLIDGVVKKAKNGDLWAGLFKIGQVTISFLADLAGAAWDVLKSLLEIIGGTVKLTLEIFWKMIKGSASAFDNDKPGVTGGAGVAGGSLVQGQKVHEIEVQATVTSVKDGLATNAKNLLGFTASADRFKDNIGAGAKAVNNILATAQRFSDKVPNADKNIGNANAKAQRFQDSVPAKKKNVNNVKASVTQMSFTGKIKAALKKVGIRLATGGVYSHGRWQPVTAAAAGGSFGTGQMFIAREAGPELVGTIGGNTAVMNNDQIVASVSAGVAQAVASVMGNGQGQPVTIVLEGDAKQFFTAMQQQAVQYVNTTGQSPFPA